MERGKPRFDKRQVLPEVPEGMELYKFHGEPVLIPLAEIGEEMVGKSGYTKRQMDKLIELEDERRNLLNASLTSENKDYQKSESIYLKPGVIFKRFINDDGLFEDVEDKLFGEVLFQAAIAFYPIDISEFLLEVDLMQGKVPDSRVFSLDGLHYKLVHVPFQGYGTGSIAIVESLFGPELGQMFNAELHGGVVQSLKPIMRREV